MRHYEIVFLVHPDQSDQTQSVLNMFSSIVTESGGKVHRLENIGSRKLAYPIHDQYKATYALLNIECKEEAMSEPKTMESAEFFTSFSEINDPDSMIKSRAGKNS